MNVASRPLSLALGGALLVLGCNAVLGIEEAELDQVEATLVCERPLSEPSKECVAPDRDACETCMAGSCDPDLASACLADGNCRGDLLDHRVCLQNDNDCIDEGGACTSCMTAPGDPFEMVKCSRDCGQTCAGAELPSICEIYCACMTERCPAEPFVLAPAGEVTDCLTYCATIPSHTTTCRISHCTLAKMPDIPGHCGHSVGRDQACEDVQPPELSCTSPDQGKLGYGCDVPDDCCSGQCRNNRCVAPG